MTLKANNAHITEGLDRLLGQFQDATNLRDLLETYLAQVQELEDTYQDLFLDRAVDTAVGSQLDVLGEIVGEARNGKTDSNYRIFIKARIAVNRSGGTIEDVIAPLSLVLGASQTIEVEEFDPAAMVVRVGQTTFSQILAGFVKQSRPVGVGSTVEYHLSAEAEIFRFASGDTPEASTTQGFGNDAGTTGGKFADAQEA